MLTTSLTFRKAAAHDISAVVRLVESAYRGDASRAGWTTEADFLDGQRIDPEGVREIMDNPCAVLLVGECAGEPVACCHLERRGDHAYFGMFAVRPQLQGAGLGKKVIAEAERRAREEMGATEMRMAVIHIREELIAFYERRGYVRTGRLTPFPYGDERFGLPKRRDLAFELLAKRL